MRTALQLVTLLILTLLSPVSAIAQTTGQIMGRVRDVSTGDPIVAAEISVDGLDLTALSTETGNFVLISVPAGEHRMRVEALGFRALVMVVRVRAGRTTPLTADLEPLPLELEGVAAEVERLRLIEPENVASHEVTLGRQLRELPVDEIEEAIELATGVSDGHFRGGRVGQESYLIDGLEIKNRFEASAQGPGFELSPSSLEELDVITGGFGVTNGSALAGVVSYVTRRGNPDRWAGRLSLLTDTWAPDKLSRGFSSLSGSIGGPIGFLGEGTTIFADILAQGFIDGDPHARGLTCVNERDAEEDPLLVAAIQDLSSDPATAHLYCPFVESRLPYQRGDKLIGFVRIDRPIATGTNLTLSLLHNRRQNELYSQEFKYNDEFQLGQQTKGWLGTLTLDWSRYSDGRATHVTARASAMKLDRYLGVLDPWTFNERNRVAGFGLSGFRFLGEDFVRSPIEEQLKAGTAVPGYKVPGGTIGSPFGPGAAGIFFTEGTPGVANWNTSAFVGGDLLGEFLTTQGHSVRAGSSVRFYETESYERVAAFLPGSSPTFARFHPATVDAFGELSLRAADDATIQIGVRYEGFRSGLTLQRDRLDFLSPGIDTGWKSNTMFRVGMAFPVPGTETRTMFRINYGQIAQAPDFSFFLDTTIGDSLRADIRRQGNPNLTFESGAAWEFGISQIVFDRLSVNLAVYFKELNNLVTSSLEFAGFADNEFTTGDFGTVKGVELSALGRWPGFEVRAGYALQQAKGVTSTAFEDPGEGLTDVQLEFPLAFDRRHSADVTLYFGRAAGRFESKWGVALTSLVRSGFPLDRTVAQVTRSAPEVSQHLPWTWMVNTRITRDLGSLPGCDCRWRAIADVRNLVDRDNIVALRRDTGTLAPSFEDLFITSQISGDVQPIPAESPDYSALADIDGDGRIDARELSVARFAAALDREDPSLFFGEDISFRLGLEVSF